MKKILIIDDERGVCLIMKMRFDSFGFEVLMAFDEKTGLQKAR